MTSSPGKKPMSAREATIEKLRLQLSGSTFTSLADANRQIEEVLGQAYDTGLSSQGADDYIAWLCRVGATDDPRRHLKLCDSDTPGAFKVYRRAEGATPQWVSCHEAWKQFLIEHPTRGGIAEKLIFEAGWNARPAPPKG